MKKAAKAWLKAAKDDLDVIDKIIDVAHLSHMVAFHAQQCIEKTFKAFMEENDIDTPKIHNLVTLFGRIEGIVAVTTDVRMLKTLDGLYIDARYPGDLGLMPDGKPSRQEAQSFYSFAKDIYETFQSNLSSS